MILWYGGHLVLDGQLHPVVGGFVEAHAVVILGHGDEFGDG